jgi:hypothetical protein
LVNLIQCDIGYKPVYKITFVFDAREGVVVEEVGNVLIYIIP